MKNFTLYLTILISFVSLAQNGPCSWTDGNYRYYVRLAINDIPDSNFDKSHFIDHIDLNYNLSTSELNFLNNSIIEVAQAFPSSQNANLQKTVSVVSNNNTMESYLSNYLQSIDSVNYYCEEELNSVSFNDNKKIKVFPNPISDNLYINLENNSEIEYFQIYDLSGKLIYKRNINKEKLISLETNILNNGIYILKLSSPNYSRTKKIIKK